MAADRLSLGDDTVNLVYHSLVFGFAFGKFRKFLFLFRFSTQHVVVDDCLIHTDGVFPVVTASGKFTGVLYAGLVAGVHICAQHVKTYSTHVNHGLIVCFHAFFHFRPGEVAAGSAGEPHNHGVIVLLQTLDGDGQILRSLQGHVVLRIFGRLSVFVGIDAEHRKISRMARPHPVVCFTAELSY